MFQGGRPEKEGRPTKTWKNQVEDIRKIGLKKEDVLNRSKSQKGVKMVMSGME